LAIFWAGLAQAPIAPIVDLNDALPVWLVASSAVTMTV
jgi:hypothetical protein